MSYSNLTMLPNPDTPLAFLPPEAAYQFSVAAYVLAGSLGVLIWDVLDNVSAEFNLLFGSRITLNTIVYFGSRIGSLGYTMGGAIFQTAPIGNCSAGETIAAVFYPVSLSCSALLFFFRLKAIYARSQLVVGVFFALWLGVLGCTMLIPIAFRGVHIGETAYCENAKIPTFTFASVLAPLIYDTLVFFAISWRLAQVAHIDMNFHDGIKVALLGKYLPAFTRGILLDGQRYFLITLLSNMLTVIMAFDTTHPISMRSVFCTINVVLTNIMACRIYRNTKNSILDEASTAQMQNKSHVSTIAFGNRTTGSTKQSKDTPFIETKTVASAEASLGINPSYEDGFVIETKSGSGLV